ncbi:MAG: hypothetical protein KJI71_02380 [Patescibacteria group bacterium]|nr:hypothetical protein [Patescibacteria group bacterium]
MNSTFTSLEARKREAPNEYFSNTENFFESIKPDFIIFINRLHYKTLDYLDKASAYGIFVSRIRALFDEWTRLVITSISKADKKFRKLLWRSFLTILNVEGIIDVINSNKWLRKIIISRACFSTFTICDY